LKRLNGWDALWLYGETPNVHAHTVKVAVLDAADCEGSFTFDVFRDALGRRLHLLQPLRYRLVDIPLKFHRPMWLENCDVDLDYHLRRVRVPSPGGRRELDGVIGQIASTSLDRCRPLWEIYFAEGMAGDRFAAIAKVHHALADGVASANLLARAMDGYAPDSAEQVSDEVDTPPSRSVLLRGAVRDHIHQIGKLPNVIRDTAKGVSRLRLRSCEHGEHPDLARAFNPPPTFINHVISPARTFASATLSLADVKATSKHFGVTINDLVLATAAGALRELLLRYDGRAARPIIASVPASISTSSDRISGNALGLLVVSLPVHIDDPLRRLELTSMSTCIAKENQALLGPELISRWVAYLPPAVALAFERMSLRDAQNKLLNIGISNVPGPRQRGRIAGATVSEIYSVGPLPPGSGINITVWSYVEQLNISVIADDRTLKDTHEMTDAMMRAFAEIRGAAGLSAELTEVDTAMPQASAVG
jgi:diacylglycerol O-acyltransferase